MKPVPPYKLRELKVSAEAMVRRACDPDLESNARKLIHCYGLERALAIIAGKDTATQADIAAWHHLGRGRV